MLAKKKPKNKRGLTRKKQLDKFLADKKNARIFVISCLFILFATTILWSFLSAKLQLSNADQLINPYLFENMHTFTESAYPGAHTFLLKWPLFYLIKILGASAAVFIVFTVLISFATVAVLAYILYKIEKRPYVFGALCLALASVLLLVPTSPYPGALLPANMAMVATRNLEYCIYLAAIFSLTRARSIHDKHFWASSSLLGLLYVSDKLFFYLSFIGSVMAAALYLVLKRKALTKLSLGWLLATLAGFIIASFIILLFKLPGFPNIVNESSTSPFMIVGDLKTFTLGIVYAVLAILTNFGANLAFGTTVIQDVPSQIVSNLKLWIFSYTTNLILLIGSLVLSARLFKKVFNDKQKKHQESPQQMAIILIWSSLAAIAAFLVTDHYFAADSRYLGLLLFTLFIASAVYVTKVKLEAGNVVRLSLILVISIIFGIVGAISNYRDGQSALAEYDERNYLVSKAVASHPVDVLVGDYWRVVPAKHKSGNKLKIMPQASCLENLKNLTSESWNVDLHKSSFAYLLTRDKSPTNYQNCEAEQVIATYGYPNSSVLISGTLSEPNEQVLFYDKGVHRPPPLSNTLLKEPNTILPTQLEKIRQPACDKRMILNIVAHEDDDLLFMNPDTSHELKEGNCVSTIYLTAGDAGQQGLYWLSRERGSEAAYNYMLRSNSVWTERVAEVQDQEFVTIANPKKDLRASLVFMHLPDGSLSGHGYKSSKYESLEKLDTGSISSIGTVDKQSSYDSDQLIDTLVALMDFYQPAEVRTQANLVDAAYPDHSDHMATGRIAQKAHGKYLTQKGLDSALLPIKFYIGYPVHSQEPNVFEQDQKEKEEAFFQYAKFDPAVCQTDEECSVNSTLKIYIDRQYQNSY